MSFTQDDQDDVLRALRGLIGGPPSDAPDQDFMHDPRALARGPDPLRDMQLTPEASDADVFSKANGLDPASITAAHYGDPGIPDQDFSKDPQLMREFLDAKMQLYPDPGIPDQDFMNDPRALARGADVPDQDFTSDPQLIREFLDAKMQLDPDPSPPSPPQLAPPVPMSQSDFAEPVTGNPGPQMAALAADKAQPFQAPTPAGSAADFIDALKAGPNAPSLPPPEPAPAYAPGVLPEPEGTPAYVAPQQRLPDADPGVQAVRSLPPPSPSESAAPDAATPPAQADSTTPQLAPEPDPTHVGPDSPPLPVTQASPQQPDAIQAKGPALMARDTGPSQALGYTPDALRGLTGRDFHSALGDRPTVNPLAFLAAAMSETPGPAMAQVMQMAAQQGGQWDSKLRQAMLDEDASMVHAANARKLAMESDPEIIRKKLDIQLGNLRERTRGGDLSAHKQEEAESPFSKTSTTRTYNAGAAARARTSETNKTNNEQKGLKADTARVVSQAAGEGQRQGQVNVDLQMAPQVNANAATKAGLEADARVPAQVAAKQAPSSAYAYEPIPRSHVVDDRAFRSYVDAAGGNRDKAVEAVTGANQMIDALTNMKAMRDDLAKRASGGDMTKWIPTDEELGKFGVQQTAAIDGIRALYHSGVLSEGEYNRYLLEVAQLSPNWDEVKKRGWNMIAGRGGVDPVSQKLAGQIEGYTQLFGTKLAARGLALGDEPGADQTTIAPAPTGGGAAADNPLTPKPVSGAFNNGGAHEYTVTPPPGKGKPRKMLLTAEEAVWWEGRGATVTAVGGP